MSKSKLSVGISYESYGCLYCDLRAFTEGGDKEAIERFAQAIGHPQKPQFQNIPIS